MDRATRPEGNIADVQHGWDVYGSDEEKVGSVSEVQNDYIIAHKGFFFPKDLYIPFSAVARIEHDRVYLNIVKDAVDGQGWDVYPDQHGATNDSGMRGASSTRAQIPDAIGTPGLSGTTDEGGHTVRASGTGMASRGEAADRREEAVLPVNEATGDTIHLHEERLQVNKQRQESGEVRIGKEVVEKQETIDVPVTREEVFVERVRGDGQPDSHSMDESAGETIRVPVSEETVNVEKVPVTTEEVRVGKREVQETRQVTGTVRQERARIENDGNIRVEDDTDMTERGKI
ncbi:MAG: YsnF/AvaK domain-containing protein [Chloroflexota bacterium]